MKLIYPVIISFFLLFCQHSLAVSTSIFVHELGTNKHVSLNEIISIYDHSKSMLKQKRISFEKLYVYENRLQQAKILFNEFISKKYSVSFTPDDVKLDWESSAIKIIFSFPLDTVKQRGNINLSKVFGIYISTTPDLAREIKQFPEFVKIHTSFRINNSKQIVIDKLLIKYLDKILYEEQPSK